MKLVMEEIGVQCAAEGAPQRLYWRQRPYSVRQIVERWQYNGDWWQTSDRHHVDLRGRLRQYYQVTVTGINGEDCSFEVFEEDGQWVLSRLLD